MKLLKLLIPVYFVLVPAGINAQKEKLRTEQFTQKTTREARNGAETVKLTNSIALPTGKTTQAEDTVKVFDSCQKMPLFRGDSTGIEFSKYIGHNLNYPHDAVVNKIEGKVIVEFVVNSKGKVTKAHVVSGFYPYLQKEAVRVISTSPRWTPGYNEGKPVSVLFTFPINFHLH